MRTPRSITTAIASIVIPNTVINIGGNPFAACNSLSSFVVEEGNPIYYSSNNCLINKNNKMLVAGCSTSTIPNDILIIGPSAFEGLHNIQTITIPEGVWAIQSHAFSGCTLQTLRIPNSVENVGQAAFSDLYEVKKIYLGSGVRRMNNDVFRGCPQLTDIYITATEVPISNNSTFNGIGNENPLTVHVPAEALDAYKASLSWSTMNLVGDADNIDDNSSNIVSTFSDWTSTGNKNGTLMSEEGNEWNCELSDSSIPVLKSFYTNNDGANESCIVIGERTSSNSQTILLNSAFSIKGTVEKLVVRATGNIHNIFSSIAENNSDKFSEHEISQLQNYGEMANYVIDFEGTEFEDATCMIAIDGESPFFIHSITVVLKGEGEPKPGDVVLSGKCGDNLDYEVIMLSNTVNVPNYDTGKDEEMPALKITINGTGAMYDFNSWWETPWTNKYRYQITEIEMPEGMTRIGNNAFGGLIHAQISSLPSTLTSIGDEAFYNIFYMPSELRIPSGVTSVGNKAFCASYGTKKIYIPANLTDIGEAAFAEVHNVEDIYVEDTNPYVHMEGNALIVNSTKTMIGTTKNAAIPAGVKHIGTLALSSVKVESITIPDGVESIGEQAFWYATITEIAIPNSVTTIGKGAFSSCNKLTKVTIGSGVTSIDDQAFVWSTNVLDVECYANPDNLAWTFGQYDNNCFKPDKATKMHVRADDLDKWNTDFAKLNVTFVGDLGSEIVPITENTTVAMESLKEENLSDNTVDNIYNNLDSNKGCGYDEQRNCLVIGKSTDMSQISDATPGSSEVKEKFNGIIIEVGPGKGSITINAQTFGKTSIAVRIGNGTPTYAAHTERGNVYVTYEVSVPTYVYIYAVEGELVRGMRKIESGENALLIYSVSVNPTKDTPTDIDTAEKESNEGLWYDLNGHAIGNLSHKGVYIRNGRKVLVK
ncbi:MAG: leucine-rich repeat protein [Prevotella sp.]|nr:leucine-rich repeat protein [Prevotella sp.]